MLKALLAETAWKVADILMRPTSRNPDLGLCAGKQSPILFLLLSILTPSFIDTTLVIELFASGNAILLILMVDIIFSVPQREVLSKSNALTLPPEKHSSCTQFSCAC